MKCLSFSDITPGGGFTGSDHFIESINVSKKSVWDQFGCMEETRSLSKKISILKTCLRVCKIYHIMPTTRSSSSKGSSFKFVEPTRTSFEFVTRPVNEWQSRKGCSPTFFSWIKITITGRQTRARIHWNSSFGRSAPEVSKQFSREQENFWNQWLPFVAAELLLEDFCHRQFLQTSVMWSIIVSPPHQTSRLKRAYCHSSHA